MPVNRIVTPFLTLLSVAHGSSDLPWVAGGEGAKPGDIPSAVLLIMYSGTSKNSCTGSVIHKDWILTAGHCIAHYDNITIYAGIADLDAKEHSVQERKALKYHIYPGFVDLWTWRGLNLIYDYGLVKLEKSLDIDNKTVMILKLDDSRWDSDEGRTCLAVGYGDTPRDRSATKLYFVEVKAFHGYGGCPCITKKAKIRASVCFKAGKEKKTVCAGDSGGPLICDGRQVAVASHVYGISKCDLFSMNRVRRYGCGREDTVSVFTYVTPALNWIRMHVGDTIPPQPD